MIIAFKRFGGWPDEVVEKFMADSNSDIFVMLHDDIVIADDLMTVTLDDATEAPRFMELAAIARNLDAILVNEN